MIRLVSSKSRPSSWGTLWELDPTGVNLKKKLQANQRVGRGSFEEKLQPSQRQKGKAHKRKRITRCVIRLEQFNYVSFSYLLSKTK